MSLYNAVFGQNDKADYLLGCLGLTKGDVGRFRNCFIEDGKIAVYTRNGGGNRESYEDVFEELSEHPNYLSDADDSFDCTYATIYFSFPEQYKEQLEQIEESPSGEKQWEMLFEKLTPTKDNKEQEK